MSTILKVSDVFMPRLVFSSLQISVRSLCGGHASFTSRPEKMVYESNACCVSWHGPAGLLTYRASGKSCHGRVEELTKLRRTTWCRVRDTEMHRDDPMYIGTETPYLNLRLDCLLQASHQHRRIHVMKTTMREATTTCGRLLTNEPLNR